MEIHYYMKKNFVKSIKIMKLWFISEQVDFTGFMYTVKIPKICYHLDFT